MLSLGRGLWRRRLAIGGEGALNGPPADAVLRSLGDGGGFDRVLGPMTDFFRRTFLAKLARKLGSHPLHTYDGFRLLLFRHMPTPDVRRDHVRVWVGAGVRLKARLDASLGTGTITVNAFENFALEHDDAVLQAVRADVRDQIGKFIGIERREQQRERMRLD